MNLIEISDKFPTELDCVQHFEAARWKKQITCPFCGSDKIGNRNKDMRFHCKNCEKSFSATTNTNLHNTRLPLKTWMYAFAIISDAKKGVSALQLKHELNISYEAAHSMFNKINECKHNNRFETLVKFSMLHK